MSLTHEEKVQLMKQLISRTKEILLNIESDSDIDTWKFLVKNTIMKVFGRDSEEYMMVINELNKLKKNKRLYPSLTNPTVTSFLDDIDLIPNNQRVVRTLFTLFESLLPFIDKKDLNSEDPKQILLSNFVKYLLSNGFTFDESRQRITLENNRTESYPNGRSNLLDYAFGDYFYDNLKNEINLTWKLGLFNSSIILSRKLIENLVIDVLRKKYPTKDDKKNIEIYYIPSQRRFKDFSILLGILNDKKNDFSPDIPIVVKFLEKVKIFKETANSLAHSMIENPTETQILDFKIIEMVTLLSKLLKSN